MKKYYIPLYVLTWITVSAIIVLFFTITAQAQVAQVRSWCPT